MFRPEVINMLCRPLAFAFKSDDEKIVTLATKKWRILAELFAADNNCPRTESQCERG